MVSLLVNVILPASLPKKSKKILLIGLADFGNPLKIQKIMVMLKLGQWSLSTELG